MRIAGWSFGSAEARFFVLPTLAIASCIAWTLLPQPSYAESPSAASAQAQAIIPETGTAIATAPPPDITLPETVAPAKPPIASLKISSQSWHRGGLGSKALVTFTLSNGNDYAVKDVEIVCTFARRDGSHLTDRRRVIPDTVSMRSRKRYSRMLVGFVNVNANKAKCSAVAASRI